MINIRVNENIELIQIQEKNYIELFELVDENRNYLREYLPWVGSTVKKEDSLNFIRMANERYKIEEYEFGIFYDKKLIGMIGTHATNKQEKNTSIGYWISENYQKKGIITLSCKKLIEFIFSNLYIEDILIKCATNNFKSCAIPERLGFKYIKVLEKFQEMYGKFVDMMLYKLNKYDIN